MASKYQKRHCEDELRCCGRLMIDAVAVEILYGFRVPHHDFKYACVVCCTFSTAAEGGANAT